MPKVHPEFEVGYREGHESGYNLGRRAVDFAKRDLAEKVMAVVRERAALWDQCAEIDSQQRDQAFNVVDDLHAAIIRIFIESGVEVKRGSDAKV